MGKKLYALTLLPIILIASLGVTGLLLLVQHLGLLQPLELVTFDQMVRLRPPKGVDPRLLVVAITEEDIRYLNRWPASDQTVAQVLNSLQQYQPKAIGLDLLRDIQNEPGHAELVKQLQKPNVIATSYFSKNQAERVDAPPRVPKETN